MNLSWKSLVHAQGRAHFLGHTETTPAPVVGSCHKPANVRRGMQLATGETATKCDLDALWIRHHHHHPRASPSGDSSSRPAGVIIIIQEQAQAATLPLAQPRVRCSPITRLTCRSLPPAPITPPCLVDLLRLRLGLGLGLHRGGFSPFGLWFGLRSKQISAIKGRPLGHCFHRPGRVRCKVLPALGRLTVSLTQPTLRICELVD